MFKHLFIFSLILCLPSIAFGELSNEQAMDIADKAISSLYDNPPVSVYENISDYSTDDIFRDGCINNGEYFYQYTIDRRCYITEKQKKLSPFNAVVALYETDVNNPYCTGTIVKDENDGNLYVYTATHCGESDPNATINIKLQNGQTIEKLHRVASNLGNIRTDAAIYKIPKKYKLPFVTVGTEGGVYDVIGYGSLPIMSDEQIANIKQTVAAELDKLGSPLTEASFSFFLSFIMQFVTDPELKASFGCTLHEYGQQHTEPSTDKTTCQLWTGNSGGPMFNSKTGELVGIATAAYSRVTSLDDNNYAEMFHDGYENAAYVQETYNNKNAK